MRFLIALLFMCFCWTGPVVAASSSKHDSAALTARLIVAEQGVTPEARSVSGGLDMVLKDGWKTYWKSPGQVGYPPEIDWSASQNVADVAFFWPAPERFTAFDIENYGYRHAVTHPLKITLDTPGLPVKLRAKVSLLICSDVCVPEEFALSLDIPPGTGIDRDAASRIATAVARVPVSGAQSGMHITRASVSDNMLHLEVTSNAGFTDPVIFPDMGLQVAFGAPDITVSGQKLTARLPVLSAPETLPPLEVTVTDGARAGVFTPMVGDAIAADTPSLWWVLAIAVLGGLILNVMPCVLPVLSIKFASALKARDQSPARVRSGFLMSALGVMAFMWALAVVLIVIRAAGGPVGWGLQFQSPVFIAIMVAIMALFAANLAGLFEIILPQSWNTRLAGIDGQPGMLGDFATGALAAVLATPCSAPFLGTAVAIALGSSAPITLLIFTALGFGLALPYMMVAARPGFVRALPRPGRWMIWLRLVLAGLMGVTALWFLSILTGVTGMFGAAVLVVGVLLGLIALGRGRTVPAIVVIGVAIMVAVQFTQPRPTLETSDIWSNFDHSAIAAQLTKGQIVFVDVTADWCLTCKANKTLVLDQTGVKSLLSKENVTAMRADWTQPDSTILEYLALNNRYGIPFNIVYGPNAPQGIALPEILTRDAVLGALAAAQG